MSEKTMYMPKDIYFGSSVFNTVKDGYYETTSEAYLKTVNNDGEEVYENLNNPNRQYREFVEGTTEYISLKNLTPLTSMMAEEKQNKPISYKKINLYLLKHRLTETNNKRKTKVKLLFK